MREGGYYDIWTARPDGTEKTNVTQTAGFSEWLAKWSPDGRKFVFAGYGTGAPTVHLYTMSAAGGPRTPLLDTPGMWEEFSDWSPDGSKVVFAGNIGAQACIYMMNADGTGLSKLSSGPKDVYPSWSPDGTKVAFARAMTPGQPIGHWQIFTVDVNTRVEMRLTIDADDNGYPAWSPDGSQIAFHSSRNGNRWRDQLWLTTPDGSVQTPLTSNSWRNTTPCWSPDGKHIAFVRAPMNSSIGDIWTINVEDRTEFQVTNTPGVPEIYPDWSHCEVPPPDTTPPVITCPANVSAEQTGPAGAIVEFTCTAVDVRDPNPTVVCVPPSGSLFPLGRTTVTCTATDASGNSSQCTFLVIVVDTTPPQLVVPAPLVVEQATAAGTRVTWECVAADICDAEVDVVCEPPSGSIFPLGTTTVTCRATDDSGNQTVKSFTATVRDTTAPVIESAWATPNVLWSPNHKMVDITIGAVVSDICDAAPAWRIVGVASNEPVNGLGDGDTAPDWQITGDHSLKLRAERSGKGSGRVYTITIHATDASGNAATAQVAVAVPHDRRK
ncbi:MAG: HYR domain-containing protein [Planctomycetes bacterium]|nr:HYR domain-containing protein [Planctomycetota bacterium]